jgi:hypothetical protein
MQVSVNADELGGAPAEVQAWFLGQMGFAAKTDPAAKQSMPTPVETKPVVSVAATAVASVATDAQAEETKKPPETTAEELLQRAVEFVEAKGQAALVPILKRMGIPNVKGCPSDKRAALFAEMAIHG